MADAADQVLLLYLDAHTGLARRLLALIAPASAAVVPPFVAGLLEVGVAPHLAVAALVAGLGIVNTRLDPRLEAALLAAAQNPAPGAVTRAAASIGLSAPRLRALARAQMPVPLSQWLLWRKLELAGREISSGSRLAEAALAGGFADQAHLTRTMVRMFGVTPLSASGLLRPPDDRFVQ